MRGGGGGGDVTTGPIAIGSFTGGLDVIRKEAWPFYRTISSVRLCWELEEPKGPKGTLEKWVQIRSGADPGAVIPLFSFATDGAQD